MKQKIAFICSFISIVVLFFFLVDHAITTDSEYLNKVCGTNHRIDAVDVVFYIHDNKFIHKTNATNGPVDVFLHRQQLIRLNFKIKLVVYTILFFETATSVILGLKIYFPGFLSEYPLLVSASNHNNRIRNICFVGNLFLFLILMLLYDHVETLFRLSNCKQTFFSWVTTTTLLFYVCLTCVRIYYANQHVKDDEILKPEYQSIFINNKVKKKEEVVIDLPSTVSMEMFKDKLKN